MANQEINSFILKFKNLWRTGRNSSLTIKSNAGKAHVSLTVELDEIPADLDDAHHGMPQRSRNSPARQRRRQRRAAARQAAIAAEAINEEDAENATNEKESTENHSVAVNATLNQPTSTTTDNVVEELVDEFCSEEEYSKQNEEYLETFQVTKHDSKMSENEILSETKSFLSQTFKFCKVKRADQVFKVVMSEKFDGGLRMILQVKNIPEVIESVEGLQTWNTEVRKLPKKRTSPSSLPP